MLTIWFRSQGRDFGLAPGQVHLRPFPDLQVIQPQLVLGGTGQHLEGRAVGRLGGWAVGRLGGTGQHLEGRRAVGFVP